MEAKELIEILEDLAQAEIDAVHSYNGVLDEISDPVIRERLQTFRDHHMDHIAVISDQIESLGGKRPQTTKDLKDHVVEALAILRTAAGGMKSALKVLKSAEESTHRLYARTVPLNVPPDLKDMLRRHFSDEKIHFEYIHENEKVI